MGRSVKKGPFVNKKLLARIEELNAANEKKVLKTWSRPSTIFPITSANGSSSITAKTSRFNLSIPSRTSASNSSIVSLEFLNLVRRLFR